MKIKLENNGIKVSVETANYTSTAQSKKIAELTAEFMQKISYMRHDNAIAPQEVTKAEEPKTARFYEKDTDISKQKPSNKNTERPPFRDRLPNNVVDVKHMTIKQAVTEDALVRCPHCGQSHAVGVTDNAKIYLMRKNYTKKEFEVVAEFELDGDKFKQACCSDGMLKKEYFTDLQKLMSLDDIKDFYVKNDSELFCPVCHMSATFDKWKKAYDSPLDFFETEQLCDACGGEVVDKVVKGNIYKHCEKCGLDVDENGLILTDKSNDK